MNNQSALSHHPFYSMIHQSFENHAVDKMEEHDLNVDYDQFEAHHKCFNEDYFVIYHSVAKDWLKKHHLDVLEAIEYIMEVQKEHFGHEEWSIQDLNYERIVNLFMYYFALEHEYELEEIFNKVKEGYYAE